MSVPDRDKLLAELTAIPQAERLDFLANQAPERLVQFKRILPRDDIKKLNQHIDRRTRAAAKPSLEKWLDDARAGRASSPDAMVEVLRENLSRLRDQDATWVTRITESCPGGAYSRRQIEVIESIYARYFRPE